MSKELPKHEITQVGPYPQLDQAPLDQAFTMHKFFEILEPDSFLSESGCAVRGIATRGELGADRKMIEDCSNLEIMPVYGVGFDAVDLDACRERKTRVTNTPDVLTRDVADPGVAMSLCLARGMIGAKAWVLSGDRAWKEFYPLKRRVHGARVGVLGLGRIGIEVARRLAGFDMEIANCDLAPKGCAPDWTFIADPVELAHHVDYLIVTLAASEKARHIMGREVIEAPGPAGMVINISRASNVHEAALLDALESVTLCSAALDVFEGEPDLGPRFLKLNNVFLQPHHTPGTLETRKAMGKLVRDNLTANFAGQPLLTPVL